MLLPCRFLRVCFPFCREGVDKKFRFDKPTCQNIRKSLRKEWIETNGLGDYASSSLICCNTRKYHGLLVADLESPAGRLVLLSSLEESLLVGGRELCFSCRKRLLSARE